MTGGDRHLDWDGSFNARDLGGLRTAGGGRTRRGAIVRSESLEYLTEVGWSALRAHGIRTIVDLRNDDERSGPGEPGAAGLETVHVALDDIADTEFWEHCWENRLDGTPLYYRSFLDRKPERVAGAIAAIAHAAPGGVLVHCVGGRDRTGLISLLALSLAGVAPEDIAADYELSNLRLPPLWVARGMEDQRAAIAEALEGRSTTARALILELLESLDVEAYLRAAGLSDADLAALRARLVDVSAAAPKRS